MEHLKLAPCIALKDDSVPYQVSLSALTGSRLEHFFEKLIAVYEQLTIQSQGVAAGGDRRFIGAGTFVGWTNVVLQSDFDDGGTRMIQNNTIPAQTFIFRPDFLFSIPQALTRSSYIWQETN